MTEYVNPPSSCLAYIVSVIALEPRGEASFLCIFRHNFDISGHVNFLVYERGTWALS